MEPACGCGHDVLAHDDGCNVAGCGCKRELKIERFNVVNHEYGTRPNCATIEIVFTFTEKWL